MACLEMYNNSDPNPSKGGIPAHFVAPMSPRISFSNDFVESAQQAAKPCPELTRMKDTISSSSSDFEFSVRSHSMMSADELFFKGRLLPFKDACCHAKKGAATITTLREELLAGEDDDDEDDLALRPPKGSTATRWKGLLGLRKAHIGSKKAEAAKINAPAPDSAHPASQEVLDVGGSNCGDVEMGM
ncbi:uncharacterized protein LOC116198776 [Punica granatum]|uniref:Uncharacterized protein LOC116198776 n=2 Tax=Punica granatum TaxID=22663 RepID=A0A6P8CKX5_PUNGR|nr:uncharacterized protein LOC116198776 [Punica granatum]PKI50135.1 hypothetical protein CRG98_029459 [Punica granatum]